MQLATIFSFALFLLALSHTNVVAALVRFLPKPTTRGAKPLASTWVSQVNADIARVHYPQNASTTGYTQAGVFSSSTIFGYDETACMSQIHDVPAHSGYPRNTAIRGGASVRANGVVSPRQYHGNAITGGDTLAAVSHILAVPPQSRYPQNTATRGVTTVAVTECYTTVSTQGALVPSSSSTFHGDASERCTSRSAPCECDMTYARRGTELSYALCGYELPHTHHGYVTIDSQYMAIGATPPSSHSLAVGLNSVA
ncbi:hypothetical protein BJ138DRAFT_1118793 [Hygrophoropsis aurantiaca]|uniref:Uncharacterized protein n=1 Tax=Hygrophoropsis aurantiaca TaxID=72124 RepID=A0ACB7ZWL7_9AGAM|nr:hypothetical protein BJ138DRAFT_1118793 [Hygrophoropsis aurantiaca]